VLPLIPVCLLALVAMPGPASTAPPGEDGLITFTPIADTYASEASPAKNYAGHVALKLRKATDGGSYRSYIRFRVTGLTGPVSSAKLRLYVTDPFSSSGGSVYRSDESWQESTLTWNNAPALAAAPLASLGSVSAGTWVELDLTNAITGDGTYSFALQNSNADGAFYSSREGPHAPELVVTESR
jgi:hypothetical protein